MDLIMEALKRLYKALGGDAQNVEDCRTNVDVLNVIASKYGGASDAILNAEAIENIAAVADKIGGGNKNRVQVIHGIVNDPWNGQDWIEMWKALNSKVNATGLVVVGDSTSPVVFQAFLLATGDPDNGQFYIDANAANIEKTLDASSGGNVVWKIDTEWNQETKKFDPVNILLEKAIVLQGGNIIDYTATQESRDFILRLPVITTIIWHPIQNEQGG